MNQILPSNENNLELLSRVHLDLENYDLVIKYTSKFLEINSRDYTIYNIRGIAKDAKSDYFGAVKDYSKAIKLNEDESQYYVNRAVSYYSLGLDDKVCKDYRMAESLGYNLDSDDEGLMENCN